MSALRSHTPRPVRLVLIVLVIYAFCWVKGWPKYYDDDELPPTQRPRPDDYAGPHKVAHDQLIVSITSTATDVYAKLAPAIIFTDEPDQGQLLLFADLHMEIGKWPVFDVLWRYPHKFLAEAKELGRYRAQVDYARRSLPMHSLRKQDEQEEKAIQRTLDKYKILQTMAAAWEYRPDRSWYVFMGDETWIHRDNLRNWLSDYNPKSRHFFGNPPNTDGPDPFAAGGDSIVLSGQVMHDLFSKESKEHKGFIKSWQDHIVDHPSAFDLVFRVMQSELQVELESVWPVISGFDPTTIPFSPTLWCERVAMMHHVTPDIASDLWKLQQERARDRVDTPFRIADLFRRFMSPENLNFTRNDWDNLSADPSNSRWNIIFEGDKPEDGRAKSGEESPEACELSCHQSAYCIQWSYSSREQPNWSVNPQTKCHLSSSIRFGMYKAPQDVDGQEPKLTWISGWNKAKFTAWADQQQCKSQPQW